MGQIGAVHNAVLRMRAVPFGEQPRAWGIGSVIWLSYAEPMIENPRTGEQIEFESSSPDKLTMHSTWTRPEHRALEHAHPNMEERFEVLAGRAAFLIDGERRDADVGDVVIVPPGSRHLAWNPTSETVELRIEMRPALRWQEFTERLFAGEDPGALLEEFGDEVTLP